METKHYTIQEAAQELSISAAYVYLLKDMGKIKTETKYGRLVISEEELCRYKCAKSMKEGK